MKSHPQSAVMTTAKALEELECPSRMSRTRKLLSRTVGLSILLATVLALPFATIAKGEVPFKGYWNTWHVDEPGFDPLLGPIIQVQVSGTGIVSHLGLASCESTDQVAILATGGITATYTYTAANGDSLMLKTAANTVDFDPILQKLSFEGTFEIVGGTGRFVGASGRGTLVGWATFNEPFGGAENEGPGFFSLEGSLSKAGK